MLLTPCGGVRGDLALDLLQPAAGLGAQVSAEAAQRGRGGRAGAVTVRRVTLAHDRAMAKVSGQTPVIPWTN